MHSAPRMRRDHSNTLEGAYSSIELGWCGWRDVRYAPDNDQIQQRSEMSRWSPLESGDRRPPIEAPIYTSAYDVL